MIEEIKEGIEYITKKQQNKKTKKANLKKIQRYLKIKKLL